MEKVYADKYALELTRIKRKNLEELYLMIKYSFEDLTYYMKYKKRKSDIPNKCVDALKKFLEIKMQERRIINFLLNHISYIDESNLSEFIKKLEKLNDKTINYFYNYLDCIIDAIELDNMENIKNKRIFQVLVENNAIKNDACNLIFSNELIKTYLGYEDDFWTFIDARTIFSDNIEDYEMDWEYVLGSQIRIQLTLPHIKDLKTALTCMKAYNKVHILYINKNKRRIENPEEQIKKYYVKSCNYLNIE